MTTGAVFCQLHTSLVIAPILFRNVVTLFALRAGQRNDSTYRFFRHDVLSHLSADACQASTAELTNSSSW